MPLGLMSNHTPTTGQDSIEKVLLQAQESCKAEQWTAVIAACKTAIVHSQQCLKSKELEDGLGKDNLGLETQTADSSDGLSTDGLSTDGLSIEQTTAALHQAKGDLFKSQGDLAAAIASYQQAIEIDPTAAEIKTALGSAYITQAMLLQQAGDTAAATRHYLQALTQLPRLFAAYSRLRYNLMRYDIPSGNLLLQEIALSCQSILQKHPQILPAQITLSYAQTKLGHLTEAINGYRSITGAPENAERRAPDFIIVGAEKSGTTSLYQYMRSHPQFMPPVEKEIDFFDLEYSCGLDWYLSHFPPASGEIIQPPNRPKVDLDKTHWITGETSANYLYSDVAPARIYEHFPYIKIVAILRDPVNRTVSRYNMMVRNGAEKRSFSAAIAAEIAAIQQATAGDDIDWRVLNRCRHIGNSLYYYHLKRWLACFPREQMLVLRSEDLFNNPQQTMQQFYTLLGLNSSGSPQQYPRHNAGDYRPVDTDIRRQLTDFFAPHTQKLETLLNQSFHWKSTTAAGTAR